MKRSFKKIAGFGKRGCRRTSRMGVALVVAVAAVGTCAPRLFSPSSTCAPAGGRRACERGPIVFGAVEVRSSDVSVTPNAPAASHPQPLACVFSQTRSLPPCCSYRHAIDVIATPPPGRYIYGSRRKARLFGRLFHVVFPSYVGANCTCRRAVPLPRVFFFYPGRCSSSAWRRRTSPSTPRGEATPSQRDITSGPPLTWPCVFPTSSRTQRRWVRLRSTKVATIHSDGYRERCKLFFNPVYYRNQCSPPSLKSLCVFPTCVSGRRCDRPRSKSSGYD